MSLLYLGGAFLVISIIHDSHSIHFPMELSRPARLNSSKDYEEDNTTIAIKIQFLAIEIARNREGFNSELRNNFKPKPRKPKEQQVTRASGINMSEIESELKQVLTGQHPLLS